MLCHASLQIMTTQPYHGSAKTINHPHNNADASCAVYSSKHMATKQLCSNCAHVISPPFPPHVPFIPLVHFYVSMLVVLKAFLHPSLPTSHSFLLFLSMCLCLLLGTSSKTQAHLFESIGCSHILFSNHTDCHLRKLAELMLATTPNNSFKLERLLRFGSRILLQVLC